MTGPLYARIDPLCGALAFFLHEEPVDGLTVPSADSISYPDGRALIDGVDEYVCFSCGASIGPGRESEYIEVIK